MSSQSPVPVAITIRNFFPPALASKSSHRQKQDVAKNFSYTRGDCINLPSCQLDIVQNHDNDETIIYSQLSSGAHPHWNHVNEHIQNSLDYIDTITARFTVQDQTIEAPLDPSQLKRISQSDTMTIPHSLPPNAILIHYDDGWTRVMPGLYSLLTKRQIIEECKVEGGEVFSEDVFDVLGEANDDVEISNQTEGAKKESLYDDKVFYLLGERDNNSYGQTANVPYKSSESTGPSQNVVQTMEQDGNFEVINSSTGNNDSEHGDQQTVESELPDPPSFLIGESDEANRIQKEVETLMKQVEYEQEQLKIEETMIHQVSISFPYTAAD